MTTFDALPVGSPFWLQLNGVWVHLEGVMPEVEIEPERPTSTLSTIDGNRYEQRAPLSRRQWSLSLRWATPAAIAALQVAADLDGEVLLYSESTANMLKPSETYGTGSVISADGVPLPIFEAGGDATVAVRSGVTYTAAYWAVSGATSGDVVYPGGSVNVFGSDWASNTFTPNADGDAVFSWHNAVAQTALMLYEGDAAPTAFAQGEGMPCPVSVADAADVLQRYAYDAYRHDYTVIVREVG